MGVAEERVLAAVRRLRERGVAECCGHEIAREVLRGREEPVVVGYAFYRALGGLVKSGRLESRWSASKMGMACSTASVAYSRVGPTWDLTPVPGTGSTQ